MTWTVKDCFSGPDCWCGVIVNPDGEECNHDGEISRKNCWYIVHALNINLKARGRINKTHPIPWHVLTTETEFTCIVTTPGLTSDDLEHFVGVANEDYNRIFVNAVNEFYGGFGKDAH